jgi:hypothetical protein
MDDAPAGNEAAAEVAGRSHDRKEGKVLVEQLRAAKKARGDGIAS